MNSKEISVNKIVSISYTELSDASNMYRIVNKKFYKYLFIYTHSEEVIEKKTFWFEENIYMDFLYPDYLIRIDNRMYYKPKIIIKTSDNNVDFLYFDNNEDLYKFVEKLKYDNKFIKIK